MEAFFRISGLPLHNVKNCRFSASFSTFYTFRSPRCDFLARYVERKFGHLHRLQLWGWRWKRNIGLRSTVSHLTTLNLRHFERSRKNIYDVIWKNWICRNSEFYNKFTGNRASPCVLGHSKICCTVTCNVRGYSLTIDFMGESKIRSESLASMVFERWWDDDMTRFNRSLFRLRRGWRHSTVSLSVWQLEWEKCNCKFNLLMSQIQTDRGNDNLSHLYNIHLQNTSHECQIFTYTQHQEKNNR